MPFPRRDVLPQFISLCRFETTPSFFLSLDGGVDRELLADADDIGVLDVVPLGNLHVAYTKALADAAEDISGGYRIDNVIAVVDKASVGILANMKRLMVSAFYSTIYHSLLVSYWAGS